MSPFVVLTIAAVIALIVALTKKPSPPYEPPIEPPVTTAISVSPKDDPISQAMDDITTTAAAARSAAAAARAAATAATKKAYEQLPRDPSGQIVQGTTELDTYCEQQAVRLVLYHVKWACYLGATQGQLTGKYYDYYDKYVEAPKNDPDQAKAVASCPLGVKPTAVNATFVPRP